MFRPVDSLKLEIPRGENISLQVIIKTDDIDCIWGHTSMAKALEESVSQKNVYMIKRCCKETNYHHGALMKLCESNDETLFFNVWRHMKLPKTKLQRYYQVRCYRVRRGTYPPKASSLPENQIVKECACSLKYGHVGIAKTYKKWFGVLYSHSNQLLYSAARGGHQACVDWVISNFGEGDRPVNIRYAVRGAVRGNHINKLILPSNEIGDREYLYEAVCGGHVELIDLDMFQTCASDFFQLRFVRTLFDVAAGNGYLSILKLFRDVTNVHCENTIAKSAATSGHIDVLKFIMPYIDNRSKIITARYAERRGHIDVSRWITTFVDKSQILDSGFGYFAT